MPPQAARATVSPAKKAKLCCEAARDACLSELNTQLNTRLANNRAPAENNPKCYDKTNSPPALRTEGDTLSLDGYAEVKKRCSNNLNALYQCEL